MVQIFHEQQQQQQEKKKKGFNPVPLFFSFFTAFQLVLNNSNGCCFLEMSVFRFQNVYVACSTRNEKGIGGGRLLGIFEVSAKTTARCVGMHVRKEMKASHCVCARLDWLIERENLFTLLAKGEDVPLALSGNRLRGEGALASRSRGCSRSQKPCGVRSARTHKHSIRSYDVTELCANGTLSLFFPYLYESTSILQRLP